MPSTIRIVIGTLLLLFIGSTLFSIKTAMAVSSPAGQFSVANPVNPVPMGPKHPYKITLAGGVSACFKTMNKGSRLELSCTVDCSWDAAQFLPDAGFNIPYPDGGYGITAETADGNPLSAAAFRIVGLPQNLESVCIYSASAGTAYLSETYP